MAVYLDNAATTALRAEALDAMLPYLRAEYANPSSPHSSGQRVRRALDEARERTAAAIGARPAEIVFTGSGSEADNLALFGLVAAGAGRGHLIISAIEHHAVLHAADVVRARGHTVTTLPVDRDGFVSEDALAGALEANAGATLVSVMHANNEIGTIERIERLAAIAHARRALFHTDAVQTVGHIGVDVKALGVDALSLSAHKFEGPKGVGALYVRSGVHPAPLIHGGGQEGGRRAGTENVAGVVGLATALDLAVRSVARHAAATSALRDELIESVLARIPGSALNGSRSERLPNNASLRFDGIDGQTMVLALDVVGFEVSTGSACTSGSLEPSHVLTAAGLDAAQARGTVRFSLGRGTTKADIASLLSHLPGMIERLRSLSAALVPGGGPSRARE
ncbi:MAG TPA: aminotransferase class V-fold PLP-dependent enzyme [Candidatus Eremiobacteraceae bacterium]|nr:aminotransferase class V-fold PLP-dependent enzyme [Candidatus Eremiobacteraceae bacterium]